MPKTAHTRQPKQPAFSTDSVTPIPTVEQIYQQRTAIDALSLEIENDLKLFAEQIGDKKKRLREFQAELAGSIRQTNAALQQLAVPVTSDVIPDPLIEPTPIQSNANALNAEPIDTPVTPAVSSPVTTVKPPLPTEPVTPSVPTRYSSTFTSILICVLFFAMLIHCRPKPTPNPLPTPTPTPTPIVITTTDHIIKEVESQPLTHNEKIVEATRRLVQEAGMEREAAYKYATEKIKNTPNDSLSPDNPPLSIDSPSPEETIHAFSSIISQMLEAFPTLPEIPALPEIPTLPDFLSDSKKKQSLNLSSNPA